MNFKISIGTVISLIASLLFASVCFFSLYFFTYGNLQKSILLALCLSFILVCFVLVLKEIKAVRRNFLQNAFLEILMLIVFLTAGIIFLIPFSHYFTVLNKKDQLKGKIETDLDNVANMFTRYEEFAKDRMNKYEYELNAAIAGKDLNYSVFINEGFKNNGESLTIQKNRLMTIFEDDLMPSKYDSTKKYAINLINQDKQLATNWILPVRFLNVINNVEKTANGWLTELKRYDNSTSNAQSTPFDYPLTFGSIKGELTQREFPAVTAIVIASLLYLILLIPYFAADRDPRNPGIIDLLFRKKTVTEERGAIL
ncbi:hypothetical protein A4H97_16475 [Niastella yeongjuensis]|uniref:Uncharacterized protein n=1 Tax=Niastella yeongjuensis TaxID=354355 RepID=A0A1V9E126_9BACT|nr:hypothetical protein [Niastella yeongjuensis]OQP39816.1 hypothetical protein A4H97_16475 [Niastella yeongjuensis]SEO06434.1 hypothetical protein SAMN05660816_02042 [Niastella yeongjuensis]